MINHGRMGQSQVSHHHTRFNEVLNRQYSPDYTNPYQPTLGSIPSQDLSATLEELANIQSRSLEMMAASQRNQQEAFHKLTKASRDKVNDSMVTPIKILTEQTDRLSRTRSTKSTKLAEPATEVSGPNSSRNPQEP